MTRPRFFTSCATFAALALALAQSSPARAQDDPTPVAAAANKLVPDLRKKLAAGPAEQKRFRLDAVRDNKTRDKLVIVGVFLQEATDTGAKAVENTVVPQIEAWIGEALKDKFKVPGLGEVDTSVKRVPVERHPHVLLQGAANAAGKARLEAAGGALVSPVEDRLAFFGAQFDASGVLVVDGARADDDAAKKRADELLKAVLDKHEAAVAPGGAFAATGALKAAKWTAGATELQARLAAEKNPPALRACRVERAYVTYDGANAGFRVDGYRVREGELEQVLRGALEPAVSATLGRDLPIKPEALLNSVLLEPVPEARKLVAATPGVDGVRIDPGFRFDASGALVPGGVHPPMSAEARAKLAAVLAAGFRELGGSKQPKDKYEAAARCPLALDPKAEFRFDSVLADVRKLAAAEMDDALVSRLYFSESGGLRLEVRTVYPADAARLGGAFRALQTEHVREYPAAWSPLPEFGFLGFAKAALLAPALDERTFDSSFTNRLREVVARGAKWRGVYVARGYFDAAGRYTLRGAVDTGAQNDALNAELERIAESNAAYEPFVFAGSGKDKTRTANKPALDELPLQLLIDRTQRVVPAYAAFDGVRVTGAKYDETANLVFEAHVVGRLEADAERLLTQLLRAHEQFQKRTPTNRDVRIVRATGDPGSEQLANFGLAYGAKLLTKPHPTDADKAKAREWLEASRLHYPNEAGVWFLSAYYHHTTNDPELARRDLFRVVELEGALAFDGPSQRKRRAAAAKDLQGASRADLDAQWLDAFRAEKDGEPRLTMTARKQ
jgi:hypothetical protein